MRASVSRIKNATDGAYRTRNVVLRGSPVANTASHYASTIPCDPSEEGLATRIDPRNDPVGVSVVIPVCGARLSRTKSHEPLVEDGHRENFRALKPAEAGHQIPRMTARPFDEGCDSLLAQLADRGVDGKAPRTSGELRIPVDW